ncbi:chemotaxis protein CheW [mine drainage metagenome]|uniref:Chemotaxis protein CheW n=1 Tax=mine drainage metagenome TaxID=410659 RepID=A0A1J5PGC4_9ZZZZ
MTTPAQQPLKSQLILDELKNRQRAKAVVDVEEQRVKIVIVVCAENRYAFYGTDIREILPSCKIFWVPGLPDYLPGLINVRGDVEAVINLGHFLDAKYIVKDSHMILMTVHGEFRSGIMVDAIEDVVDIPERTIQPPLSTLNGTVCELVIGNIERAGINISLLDIGKLATLITL